MFVFYTNFGIPKPHAACARGFLIFIRPEYKDDIGLLEHEKVHVKQFLCTLGLHSILYRLSERYRLWAEVQAYKVQLIHSPGNEALFATFIAERYGLDISTAAAAALLKE